MESFYTLLKVVLYIYLGTFSYILYQLLFYHQKRFLFIKTIFYFGFLAYVLIQISNRYHIFILHVYLLFYFLGFYLSRRYFKDMIEKNNKEFRLFIRPLKSKLFLLLKWASIPPFYYFIKQKLELNRHYKKHPNLKPKTIYELF